MSIVPPHEEEEEEEGQGQGLQNDAHKRQIDAHLAVGEGASPISQVASQGAGGGGVHGETVSMVSVSVSIDESVKEDTVGTTQGIPYITYTHYIPYIHYTHYIHYIHYIHYTPYRHHLPNPRTACSIKTHSKLY